MTRTMLCTLVAALAWAAPAQAAPPPPCGGAAQVADAAGDGHHPNEDVVAAWLTEAQGRLQAVVQVRQAVWEPAHDDSEAAEFALLYALDGVTRYVRAIAGRGGQLRFDHGTWTRRGSPQFASAGPTQGSVVAGADGYALIDVPAVPAGTRLASPFVLTWDGISGDEPHWVDRAPGRTTPDEESFGGDFVAGACAAAPAPGAPAGAAGSAPAAPTSAVKLTAPPRVTGPTRARITGRVVPGRAGIPVTLSVQARSTTTLRGTTAADGTFAVEVPLGETTRLRATADGIASPTSTVTMRSTVSLVVRRAAGGGVVLSGAVRPGLPGRVLLLRTTSARPTASVAVVRGRFRVRLRSPRPGRYQAVYVPSGDRAERSTSKAGAIR